MAVEVSETFRWTNTKHQYFATIAANLISLSHGCIMGWVSPALPKLTSGNTPLTKSGPLNNDEISWVGSVNSLGSLLGSITFGYFTSLLGSKRTILFLALPLALFWLLIYFGDLYYHILIARFIGGWAGGGVQSTVLLYISEISNDNIRGRLGSVTLFIRNVGILLAFVVGAGIDYKYIPCICIIVPIVFALIFMTLPNTPQFYLRTDQIQKAEDALKYYKGYKGKSQQERIAINEEFERLKAIACVHKKAENLQISDFFSQSAMKGIGIGIALTTFSQLTSAFTIITYAMTTFETAGASIDPYISSIMLGVALLFGSLTTTYLADKLGRKLLNLTSLMGSACGLLFTALFHYLTHVGYELTSYSWMPVAGLCFVIFIASSGIIPLSFICSVEILPSKIRTYGVAVIASLLSIITFITVKMYPIMLRLIDLHYCLSIYGVGCIVGFIFVLFVLDETSGQPLDDVGLNKTAKLSDMIAEKPKRGSVFVISGDQVANTRL